MDNVFSHLRRQGVFRGAISFEPVSAGASGPTVYAGADRYGKYI